MTEGEPLLDFLDDMRRLRRECPWKREQTHRSLARYLQEETAETLEAIDTGDSAHLREELGDLLLQVYFHAVIAEETGDFTLDDVARGISDKMHRRNPHVFGADGTPAQTSSLTAAEVDDQWQRIKAEEKARQSPYDGIPPGLSALLLATKVLERRPSALADSPTPGTADHQAADHQAADPQAADHQAADHQAAEHQAAELGDRLLALVVEAHAAGLDPEQALRDTLRRTVLER